MPRIVYDRRVNLGFPGAQRLHPFDLRKFARAWKELRKSLAGKLDELHVPIGGPVEDEALLLVHKPEFLQALRQSATVAQVIEVPALRRALVAARSLRPATNALGDSGIDCGRPGGTRKRPGF